MSYIVVEHVEETYSPWLLYEYINASMMIGKDRIIFSNIGKGRIRRILRRYGKVYKNRIRDYIDQEDLIILDPVAGDVLTPEEASQYKGIVVGGILGDHPPRGRTSKYISRFYPKSLKRSLGDGQLSIDGAAYTAYIISNGYRLETIAFTSDIEIKSEQSVITLPYKYPIIRKEIILSHTIRRILEVKGLFDEYWVREF